MRLKEVGTSIALGALWLSLNAQTVSAQEDLYYQPATNETLGRIGAKRLMYEELVRSLEISPESFNLDTDCIAGFWKQTVENGTAVFRKVFSGDNVYIICRVYGFDGLSVGDATATYPVDRESSATLYYRPTTKDIGFTDEMHEKVAALPTHQIFTSLSGGPLSDDFKMEVGD